jgi:hypothetical protein
MGELQQPGICSSTWQQKWKAWFAASLLHQHSMHALLDVEAWKSLHAVPNGAASCFAVQQTRHKEVMSASALPSHESPVTCFQAIMLKTTHELHCHACVQPQQALPVLECFSDTFSSYGDVGLQ